MAMRQRRNSGPSGLADVRVLKSGVRVTFQDGEVYDMPSNTLDGRKSGTYLVSLSADKSRLFLKAPKGKYLMRFVEIGNRVNGVPVNTVNTGGPRTGKDGSHWVADDELVFVAVFEIVSEGLYEGLKAQTYVPYSFAAPISGDGCDFYDKKRNLARLEAFLGTVGDINIALDTGLKFSPDSSTMLIQVEKILQSKGKLLMGDTNDKGFVVLDSLSELPADFAPKAPAKKGKKS